jgi:hypothetical protein
LCFFSLARAQVQSGDIVLDINPPYPRVGEEATATLSSYVTDLDTAVISWTLNDNAAISGVGKKVFSFQVAGSGFPTTVSVQIETSTGAVITKSATINPADIDLLWEAPNSYVPPFYRGKALLSSEGTVKVVAIPSTSNLGGLSYDWNLDGNGQPDSSGYDKSSITFQNSFIDDSNVVNTTITDLAGNGVGTGNITVKPGVPKIIFYEKDPIFGTKWETALNDTLTANKNGEIVVAEPYFFSSDDVNLSNLDFVWSLDDEQIATPTPKNMLSFKPESGKSGTGIIKLVINNTKTLFQSIDKELNVTF